MTRCIWSLGLVIALALASMAQAGRARGPGLATDICEAFDSVSYREVFFGGERAVVTIVGDGDTDLDLFVYDSQGRLVAQGIGYTDVETVSWIPPRTGTYRIVVRNLGSVWNRFTLTTN